MESTTPKTPRQNLRQGAQRQPVANLRNISKKTCLNVLHPVDLWILEMCFIKMVQFCEMRFVLCRCISQAEICHSYINIYIYIYIYTPIYTYIYITRELCPNNIILFHIPQSRCAVALQYPTRCSAFVKLQLLLKNIKAQALGAYRHLILGPMKFIRMLTFVMLVPDQEKLVISAAISIDVMGALPTCVTYFGREMCPLVDGRGIIFGFFVGHVLAYLASLRLRGERGTCFHHLWGWRLASGQLFQ